MNNQVNEININLGSIELDIFYEISPVIGLNILYIYHQDTEISHWLNHLAVKDIKKKIWEYEE